MTPVLYIIVNLIIWSINPCLFLKTTNKIREIGQIYCWLSGFGFMQNIWCSFAEYIRSPRNLGIFTRLENTSILYFSEFTKVKVLSVTSNTAIKKCLVKI